jgi:hypothetical protein
MRSSATSQGTPTVWIATSSGRSSRLIGIIAVAVSAKPGIERNGHAGGCLSHVAFLKGQCTRIR